MAFHVACPITCRTICFCTLGFPQKLQTVKGKKDFLDQIFRVQDFFTNSFSTTPNDTTISSTTTVQVSVPRVVPSPPPASLPPPPSVVPIDGLGGRDTHGGGGGGGGDGEDRGEELLSLQSKRFELQKKAVEASLAAEDYARKFETGNLAVSGEAGADALGEYQNSSSTKVMCRICFRGEDEGSEKATKMPSCKMCKKRYHGRCLKKWGQHRDLFDWSSWVCPSCRTCEICRRTGDPTKFMFCKRCDGAYHCYCQQPPHKNVSTGTYLCPKHTRCHSCKSTVHGSGLSTRWFLGYSFCDACGRLFVKGKYCPVCLKVYRDSETTPMVCCDVCERWVHCQCDGISDEKYLQFQADKDLYYKCTACRGECYQVKDLDDAVQEIWRRRDEADQDQIASLRAAAGLPSQAGIAPYSDDEENSSILPKSDYGRISKTSFNSSGDISAKKPKESGKKSKKKYEKKKGNNVTSICAAEDPQRYDRQTFKFSLEDQRNDRSEIQEIVKSSGESKENCSINQAGIMKHNFGEEIKVNSKDKSPGLVHSRKSHGSYLGEGSGKNSSKSENVKGKKLVIHLGLRNRNAANSPTSEASSHHKEQDLTASYGSEDASDLDDKYRVGNQERITKHGYGKKLDFADQSSSKHSDKDRNRINLGKVKPEISFLNPKNGRGNLIDASSAVGKSSLFGSTGVSSSTIELGETHLRRHSKGMPSTASEINNKDDHKTSGSSSLQKDLKPLLKLKFKNPYLDHNLWGSQHDEEKGFVKGQRSKRKRRSPISGKTHIDGGQDITPVHQDNPINEVIDANWIFQKLGKDAIGKIVEVHQPSDNSWKKGVVTDVDVPSTIAVRLEDGRSRTLELGKDDVRFVSQKQKRSRR